MWYLASTSWYCQYWKWVFLWRKKNKKTHAPFSAPLLHNSLMVHVVVWAARREYENRLWMAVLVFVMLFFTPSLHLFFWTKPVLLLSQLSKGKQTIQYFHILIFYIYSLNLLPSCWSVNSSYVFWRQTQHDPVMLRSSCPLKGLGFHCVSLKNVWLQIDNTVWYSSTKSFSICQGIQEQ